MHILVISNCYPSKTAPNNGVFVYNIIQEFANANHQVSVISADAIKFSKSGLSVSSYGEERCQVYRPKYISASAKWIFNFNTYRIGEYFQIRTIRKILREKSIKPDLVYAHFLSNAFIAVQVFRGSGIPVIAAVGEYNNIDVRRAYYSQSTYEWVLRGIEKFIAVSPQVESKLMSLGVTCDQIRMLPNGVDLSKFYPRDRVEMRKKYGLPLDKKLVIFVGRLIHNKGPLRVLEALKGLKNTGVIFVGSGIELPEDETIVFNSKVPSNHVPELLSAADIFVLPTLHEGSCNAIVEAMACGLPIVSSDIPEIHVQCDPDFSILVDPLNVEAIHNAIKQMLQREEEWFQMSTAALNKARHFDIKERARKILEFIQDIPVVVNE